MSDAEASVVRPVLADVTLIIPTLGRPQLRDCLASVLGGSHWPVRVIVIDQGASEEAALWVAEVVRSGLGVEHVSQPRRGIGRAMNLGLSLVRTPLVAVTHDDCRVAANWLDRLTCAVREDPHSIHTGRVEPEGNEPVPSVNTSMEPAVFRRPTLQGEMLFPANMGCTLDVARRVGPFEEDDRMAAAAEDNEWCYRALRAGVSIRYGPQYAVRHLAWRDAEARERTYRGYARSQGTFYGKYLRRGDFHFAVRVAHAVAWASVRGARGWVRRDRDAIARARSVFTDLLPGFLSGFVRPGPRVAG